jgi:Toprim domain
VTAAALARALEERGIRLKRYQPGEHRAPCPECNRGKRDDALAVRIEGDGSATWICHRCDWRDAVSDREQANAGADRPRRKQPQPQPDPLPTAVRDALRRYGQADWRPPALPDPNTKFAKTTWAEAFGLIGTAAEAYLRRRGLWPRDPDSTVVDFYPWAKLRFHPRCRLPEDLQQDLRRAAMPALIVAINDPIGNLVAVQRIYLTEDGHKAPVPKPKRTLGPVKGGAARLADWRTTDTLALTEGIEDALAYMQLTGSPTCAACGAGMVAGMILPLAIRNVVIVADADEPGMKAAKEAYTAFTNQGRDVRVIRPIGAKDAAELAERAAA